MEATTSAYPHAAERRAVGDARGPARPTCKPRPRPFCMSCVPDLPSACCRLQFQRASSIGCGLSTHYPLLCRCLAYSSAAAISRTEHRSPSNTWESSRMPSVERPASASE